MAISCGINVNLNNLQGTITTDVATFVNLSSSLGSPAGLAQAQSLLGPAVTGSTAQFQNLIPATAVVPQSLRNDLNSLVALPAGSPSALAGIAQFVTDYTGLQDISGFGSLNLNDLAASVFSVTGTFDPCAKTFDIPSVPSLQNIPNIIKNPVTGALEQLPAIQPELGSTTIATATKEVEAIADSFNEALGTNKLLDSSDEINETLDALQSNIQPAVEDMVRKLPTGEEVLEMKQDLVNRLLEKTDMLKDIPLGFPDVPFTIPKIPDPGSFLGTKPTSTST